MKRITSALTALTYWKLAIFLACNGWGIAVLAAFLGFTDDGPEWKTPTMRIIRLVCFCLLAGNKWLEGFLNQTVGQLRGGRIFQGHNNEERTEKSNETKTG